jgi:hypothetical protein
MTVQLYGTMFCCLDYLVSPEQAPRGLQMLCPGYDYCRSSDAQPAVQGTVSPLVQYKGSAVHRSGCMQYVVLNLLFTKLSLIWLQPAFTCCAPDTTTAAPRTPNLRYKVQFPLPCSTKDLQYTGVGVSNTW